MSNQTTQTKTLIVVSVLWMPVVAIGGATIVCIVDPRAAADNTATVFLPGNSILKGLFYSNRKYQWNDKKIIRRYAAEQWSSAQ